jgi:hypothetical protein
MPANLIVVTAATVPLPCVGEIRRKRGQVKSRAKCASRRRAA